MTEQSSTEPHDWRGDLKQVARGFMMGGADVIPGVSGGTVALIVGVYERLVNSLAQVNSVFIGHVLSRRWSKASDHIDLRFLATLGIGIALGILCLASTMNRLLTDYRTLTLATFSGLIFASTLLVARIVNWSTIRVAGMVIGTIAAYFIVGLPMLKNPPDNLIYTFFCGSIAICAMILPGISGAFILLILGRYFDLTGIIKAVLHGDLSLTNLLTVAVFCTGCLTGLLSFSRLLKRLLEQHKHETLAVLTGVMLGSLRKLWPFKIDVELPSGFDEAKGRLLAKNVIPDEFSPEVVNALGLFVLGVTAILLLDFFTDKQPDAIPGPMSDADS